MRVVALVVLVVLVGCGRLSFDPLADGAADSAGRDGPPDPSLVAYWPFDDSSGVATAADATGHGNTLALVNGVTWVAGERGGGVHTNGMGQFLQTATNLDLSATSAITVSLWLRYAYGGIVSDPYINVLEATPNFNFDTVGFAVFVDDTNDCPAAEIGIGVSGDVGGSAGCYAPPSSNVWHHLVAVFDKTQPGCCEAALYIDGTSQIAMPTYVGDNANNFGVAPLYLMSRGGAGAFAAGDLDELAIYARALTPAEIARL